jgi:hypothetical protein
MTAAQTNCRPVRWPVDAEFCEVIADRTRAGDRLILLALRVHDLEPDNPEGAYPSYRTIAEFTGLSGKYVRNRLSAMRKDGLIVSEKRGRLAHYFIISPERVTPQSDTLDGRRVTDVSPPEDDMSPLGVTDEVSPLEVTGEKERVTEVSPAESDTLGATCHQRVTNVSPLGVHRKGKGNSSNNNGRRLSPSLEEQLVLDHYQGLHPRRRISGDKQVRAVRNALKLGFTADDLCHALTGNARDLWHTQASKQDIGFVLRDTDQINNFIAKYEDQETPADAEFFA